MSETREELSVRLEEAILVSVELPDRPWISVDPLDELRGLARTAGARPAGELLQRRQSIDSNSYIGKGKLEELCQEVEAKDADVVIFDNDLTPAQTRSLEKATNVKVLDRSELILDIFATHARSLESRLQVELAQLEYSLPRLRQMWSHLGRIKGGIGLRGPGETQLEEDRRLVTKRIQDLKKRLSVVQGRKEREVRSRRDEHTISLVGYTNAGKSTLMNRLTGADVKVENKLFSTLDTRTRQWHLKDFGKLLLSDTVGFIRNLPHHLIASFKATLEEARQARLLLHVVDASSPFAEQHIQAVREVLEELECGDRPTLLVLNKKDQVPDLSYLQILEKHHPASVAVSARTGEGIDELGDAIVTILSGQMIEVELRFSAGNGKVQAYLGAKAEIIHQEYREEEVLVRCLLPQHSLRFLRDEGIEHHVLGDLDESG